MTIKHKDCPSVDSHINRSFSSLKVIRGISKLGLLFVIIMLSGCASFGRGVAEAFINKFETQEDNRTCEITSKGFDGINGNLEHPQGETKILMVHGVGNHIPGYANLLFENLAHALELDVVDRDHKDMTLTSVFHPGENLGNLRLTRWSNRDRSKSVLFYELTWSIITEQEKKIIAYDNLKQYTSKRASINNRIKEFSNDIIPDPMVYLGDSHQSILASVSQAYCWMLSVGWDDFPTGVMLPCNTFTDKVIINAKRDKHIFITHSLGSRITIDAMQHLVSLVGDKEIQRQFPDITELVRTLQNKEITIFMLSNQLPLLQIGRPLPNVVGDYQQYCEPGGTHYGKRFTNETHIIAFSDPNDLFSYPLETSFKYKYLDTRLCSDISNIAINLTNTVELFGMASFANLIKAHTGYAQDERTMALLAYGIGDDDVPQIIRERCEWTVINNK